MKFIKKGLCLVLTMLILVSAASFVSADGEIKVVVGGKRVYFDVQPQIINDRTMVPLRAIFEAIGALVEWNGETRTVTAERYGTEVSLTIDSNVMYVNGESVTLESPACIIDSRTLVPVRAISEAFELKVEWNAGSRTVKVKSPVSLVTGTSYGATYEYDENGNKTAVKFSDEVWATYEYDEYGNMTYTIDSDGNWEKYEYDENGNKTYMIDSDGYWEKDVYDENGVELYYEDHLGRTSYEYDENGNLAKILWYNGYTENCIYDEEGNLIRTEGSDGSWTEYGYDENGYDAYMKDSEGYWEKYIYDENGYETYYEDSEGFWEKYEYDKYGNLQYFEDSEGFWIKYEYDEKGNLLYDEDSDGYWTKYGVEEI